jgi:ribosomal protein L31
VTTSKFHKYLVFAENDLRICFISNLSLLTDGSLWVIDSTISTDCYFCDWLVDSDGFFVGIRYNMDQDVDSEKHPVWSRFLNDYRVTINRGGGYIDLVIPEGSDISKDDILVDSVQDFGIDSIFRCGDKRALVFDLSDPITSLRYRSA